MSVGTIAPAGVRNTQRPAAGTATTDVVLAAHGSRDPRAAVDTRKLVSAVARVRPDLRVREAYLDFTAPALGAALDPKHGPSVVVPLLFTPAYHARVDVPGVVAVARDRGVPVTLSGVLGPGSRDDPATGLLVNALIRRLSEAAHATSVMGAEPRTSDSSAVESQTRQDVATGSAVGRLEAVVLGAAGSRDLGALRTVDLVADALGARLGVPCRAGYASGGGSLVGQVVDDFRTGGARTIGYASLFLANGRLPDRAADGARAAGARVLAAPLSDAPEIATLVGIRIDAATRHGDS